MIIECQTCGCIYKINAENEEDDCPVTAELIECVMCFSQEEELEPEEPLKAIVSKRKSLKEKKVNRRTRICEDCKTATWSKWYVGKQLCDECYDIRIEKESVKKESKRGNKKYTDENIEFLRENCDGLTNKELTKQFNKKFGTDVKVTTLTVCLSNNNIKRKLKAKKQEPIKLIDPHQKEIDEKLKIKRKGMSEEAVKLIEDNYMEKTDEELRELIADKTGSFHQTDKIEKYRETNGMIRPRGWKPGEYVPEDEE